MTERLAPRRAAGAALIALLIIAFVMMGTASYGGASMPENCPVGNGWEREWTGQDPDDPNHIGGEWGDIRWSSDSVAWRVNDGWSIRVCFKSGSPQGGPTHFFQISGPSRGVRHCEHGHHILHVSVKPWQDTTSTTEGSTSTSEGSTSTSEGSTSTTQGSTSTTEGSTSTTEGSTSTTEGSTSTTEGSTSTTEGSTSTTEESTSTTQATDVLGGSITSSTEADDVTDDDTIETLPFTGPGLPSGRLAGIGVALLVAGILTLATARKPRDM